VQAGKVGNEGDFFLFIFIFTLCVADSLLLEHRMEKFDFVPLVFSLRGEEEARDRRKVDGSCRIGDGNCYLRVTSTPSEIWEAELVEFLLLDQNETVSTEMTILCMNFVYIGLIINWISARKRSFLKIFNFFLFLTIY